MTFPDPLLQPGFERRPCASESLSSPFLAEMAAKQVDIACVVRETFGKGCVIRDCAGNLIEFVEQAED